MKSSAPFCVQPSTPFQNKFATELHHKVTIFALSNRKRIVYAGNNRFNNQKRHEDVLWHMYTNEETYLNEINKIFPNKYDLNNVKNIVNI